MVYMKISPSFDPKGLDARSHYILLVISLAAAASVLYFKHRACKNSPPTVLGHWFYKNQKLIEAPWRGILLATVYKPIYGDIIQLSNVFKTRVILNSLDVISEALDKQASVTSDRPRNVMLFEMAGVGQTIAFRNHDEQHKKLRRVVASGLHPAAARSYSDLHDSTCAYFLRSVLARIGGDSSDVNYSKELAGDEGHSKVVATSIQDSIGRFILRMTFGYVASADDPALKRTIELVKYTGSNFAKHFWVNDFPILRFVPEWFPGAGFKRIARRMREMRARNFEETFEPVLENARQGRVQLPSYVSNLIELKGGKDISEEDVDLVKWTSGGMFAAGSTTTTALVHSFIFAMCTHPDIAAQVQAEIDAQVGRDRIPTLEDRKVMPYMEAVLQEVIRFYPVFPLGLEHCASQDFDLRGYKIKKGTIIEANIWALTRDPALYPNPTAFDPSRFLKPSPDPDPRRFIFGFGRRVCPGQHVANNGAFTLCAGFASVFCVEASEETRREVERCKGEEWKMFMPYGPLEPKPFGCTVRVRDERAAGVLEACREASVIA